MKEVIKEELKNLEAEHPTRFHNLKLQLKEFINHLDEQNEYQQPFEQQLYIPTQESSSRKKRVREGENDDDGFTKTERPSGSGAVKKAEACLRKIKELKSFFCSSDY